MNLGRVRVGGEEVGQVPDVGALLELVVTHVDLNVRSVDDSNDQ